MQNYQFAIFWTFFFGFLLHGQFGAKVIMLVGDKFFSHLSKFCLLSLSLLFFVHCVVLNGQAKQKQKGAERLVLPSVQGEEGGKWIVIDSGLCCSF